MARVLIISPLVDYGGREIEVNIIAKSITGAFDVRILSTITATNSSEALKGLNNVSFDTLDNLVLKQYKSLRILAYMSYIWNGKKKPSYLYLNNKVSERFFNLKRIKLNVLKKEIVKSDLIWVVADLEMTFLPNMIAFCKQNSLACIVRTTRSIFELPKSLLENLKSVSLFVHHSKSNAQNLMHQMEHTYKIVDQGASSEKKLLSLKVDTGNIIKYGFLGRFSESKQTIPLVNFFKDYKGLLYLGGDGKFKNYIVELSEKVNNIKYLGYFNYSNIQDFFEKIDVLIIPSLEESGPLVGVEAMAAGKVIISTKVGAMNERLGSSQGVYWLEKDLSNLEGIISELDNMSTSRINQLKNNNRSIYLENYTLRNIQNQYLDISREYIK